MTKKTFIVSLSQRQYVYIRQALENNVTRMKQIYNSQSIDNQGTLRIMIRDQTNMQRLFS